MGLFKRESTVERLARETGWCLTFREHDMYGLRPGDGSRPHRIRVRYREDYLNVTFLAFFPIRFPLASVTPELTMGLLIRNCSLPWAKWCIEVAGSCEAQAYLYGSLPTDGLVAETFDVMCTRIVEEMDAVYSELHAHAGKLGAVSGGTGQFRSQPQPGRGMIRGSDGGMRFLE